MEGLVLKFDLSKFKAGKAIKISSRKINFEGDCIIIVATSDELNLAYFDKDRGCIQYQLLTIEDIQQSDYNIRFLH
ncbi:TPA: hypothetical protein KOQ79_003524 [Clostridioides difficile]|nr:hypothetical protein [Clostridioides difficile]HBF5457525.1 hypothetical protein [Clostridioides difficile]